MSVKTFYDTLAPRYDAVRFGKPYARFVDGLERAFLRRHGDPGIVLEIGAGTGRLTTTLAGLATRVVAVDVSAEMLRVLRSRLENVANVEIGQRSVLQIAELDEFGRFDTVVCFRMLPHLEDIDGALALIHGALRPGGRAIFDLWNSRSVYFALRAVARRGRVYTRCLSPAQMTAAIAAAGLRVEACRGWGHLMPVRTVLDRLPERAVAGLFAAVEAPDRPRLRGGAHALMFSCVKPMGTPR